MPRSPPQCLPGHQLQITLVPAMERQATQIIGPANLGPSGWRTTHIQRAYQTPISPPWLCGRTRVDHVVVDGDYPTAGGVRVDHGIGEAAQSKNVEQTTVRPILCTDALVMFSMGVVCSGAGPQKDAAVGDHQYGVGLLWRRRARSERVRAATKLRPDQAIVSWSA